MRLAKSLLVVLVALAPHGAFAQETGFLVAAPDRGFAGNEAVRDAFAPLADRHTAELVFVADAESGPYVDAALENLSARGVRDIVVMPLFLSASNSRFELVRELLDSPAARELSISWSRSFGESYFAVEMLTDRIRNAAIDSDSPLVVVGYGGSDTDSLQSISGDLERIASAAGASLMRHDIDNVVFPDTRSSMRDDLEAAAWEEINGMTDGGTLLPLHMGSRLDSMMSFDGFLRRDLPEGVSLVTESADEEAFFSMWMQREANRRLAADGAMPGIVFLAHGADFHWNEKMRDAAKEITDKYPVEFAFSMADAPSIRRAVDKLEERGVSAAVVVRVFGMPESFLGGIERLIGHDVETGNVAHGHGGMRMMGPPPDRLRTPLMVTTAGGLEDHPLFAQALLDRVFEVSEDPGKETVIIAAHGQGRGQGNERWLEVLGSLATQMKAMGGDVFRDVRYQTWQEDWEEERDARIESVRSMVEEAQADGGIAIVVAARTTGYGPTDTFLEGMTYRKAPGFAPHPLFSQWIEEQVEEGVRQIRRSLDTPVQMTGAHAH